jgi:hypothetical protein
MYPRNKWIFIFVCALLGGCALQGEGGEPEAVEAPVNNGLPAGCDAAALAAMCPPGSQPLTGREAFDACQGQGGVQITDNTGAIAGVCAGQGACLVVCNLQDPCQCGVERIDNTGIYCVPCELSAACGNALCEGGEDPQSCPVDCAALCQPEQGRCAGAELQLCQDNGSWATVACRADQACEVSRFAPNMAYCQTAISPSGGTRPPIAPAPELAHEPAGVARLAAQLTCINNSPTECFGQGFVLNNQILAQSGRGVIIFDPLTDQGRGVSSSLPINTKVAVSREEAAWCAERQVRVLDLEGDAVQNMSSFVDDSIPLSCAAVGMNREGRLVAASMQLEDAPMVAVWEAETGSLYRLLRFVDPELGASQAASAVAIDPGGRWLVECRNSSDGGEPLLIVWNLEEGRTARLLQFEGGCGDRILIRPGHFEVYVNGTLWDLETGQGRWSLRGLGDAKAAVSPDGSVFAVGWQRDCPSCTVVVDADSGRILRELGGIGERAFSDDGRYLMSGSSLYEAND